MFLSSDLKQYGACHFLKHLKYLTGVFFTLFSLPTTLVNRDYIRNNHDVNYFIIIADMYRDFLNLSLSALV